MILKIWHIFLKRLYGFLWPSWTFFWFKKKVFWVGTPKTLNARNIFFFTKVEKSQAKSPGFSYICIKKLNFYMPILI